MQTCSTRPLPQNSTKKQYWPDQNNETTSYWRVKKTELGIPLREDLLTEIVSEAAENLWQMHQAFFNEEYVICTLANGLQFGFTHWQIAGRLNSNGLYTVRGKCFTEAIVRTELYKIRNPEKCQSRLRRALLRMIEQGLLSEDSSSAFFRPHCRGRRS